MSKKKIKKFIRQPSIFYLIFIWVFFSSNPFGTNYQQYRGTPKAQAAGESIAVSDDSGWQMKNDKKVWLSNKESVFQIESAGRVEKLFKNFLSYFGEDNEPQIKMTVLIQE